MNIRDATPDDASAIWDMLRPVFRAGETYAVDSDISQADALAYWMAERTYVIEKDGTPAGTYYIKANQKGGGAHVCNCGFVTAPDHEGQGVARAMLTHSLASAKAIGFEAMQFNFVLASNTRAVASWEKSGFNIIGTQPRAFRHPDGTYSDALMMHKFL